VREKGEKGAKGGHLGERKEKRKEKRKETYEHPSSPLSASWMKRDGEGTGVRIAVGLNMCVDVGI